MFRTTLAALLLIVLAACSSAPPVTLDTLPKGDATHGAALFSQSIAGAPPCTTCHTLDDSVLVGPGLKGIGARAGSRVEGQSDSQYLFNSLTKPADFLVPGFPNAMYNNYAGKLSAQDIADLIAYLMTL